MFRGRIFRIVTLVTLLAAGCSRMEGLRVLTGQADQNTSTTVSDQAVEALDLVMADKTGATDPGLMAAADRIEAADDMIDIIEVRKHADERVFIINMLFAPPQSDTSTLQGQIDQLDALRRAFEVTWQGMMQQSEGTDTINVRMIYPQSLSTLDHGRSVVGFIIAEGTIERAAAASYLAGARNLSNFYDMILDGRLTYQRPTDFQMYQGTPNHPMFMLAAAAAATAQ
jgi:hypothetical protein